MRISKILGIIGCVCWCSLLLGGEIRAGSLHPIETLSAGTFSLGLYGDFTNDRNLVHAGRPPAAEELRNAELNGTRVLLKPAYAPSDVITVYGLVGTGKDDISTQGYEGGVYKTPYIITFDPDICFGAGVTFNSDIDEYWFWGAEAQFLLAEDTAKAVKNPAGMMTVHFYRSSRMQEWQTAVFAARRLDMFTVCAGVKYFDADLKMSDAKGEPNINFRVQKNTALFLGIDIPMGMTEEQRWTTSLELTVADGLSLGLGVRALF